MNATTTRHGRLPEIVSTYELTQLTGLKKQWLTVLMRKPAAPPYTDLGMTKIWNKGDAVRFAKGNHRVIPEEGWDPPPQDVISLHQIAAIVGRHRMGVYRKLDRRDYGKPWVWCPACHTAAPAPITGHCPPGTTLTSPVGVGATTIQAANPYGLVTGDTVGLDAGTRVGETVTVTGPGDGGLTGITPTVHRHKTGARVIVAGPVREHAWLWQPRLRYTQLECGKVYHGVEAHLRWVTANRPRGRQPKSDRLEAA